MKENAVAQIQGMFFIIDHGDIRGLDRWCGELHRRRIPAVVHVERERLEENGGVIKELSDKGFEICGFYNKKPFWDEPYNFQYEEMSRIRDRIQACTGKKMRIFGSRYSGYNESTLKIADALGIEYISARGAFGPKAVVFKAEEYNARLIFVSNVPSKEMGSGALCDQSLWSRGETPGNFKEILFKLNEPGIILVAQTHLSGSKLNWWNVYQDFFDANIVSWKSLDEFATGAVVLPYKEIPVNREMNYAVPQPKIPLEQEPDLPAG